MGKESLSSIHIFVHAVGKFHEVKEAV